MSIGTFGPVTFEVSAEKTRTFDDFSRKTSAKFEQHDIISQKAKLEFISPGLDEVSFQVVFSAFHGLNPLNEVKQLREIVQKGEYHPLVIGGTTLGDFAVENVSEAWRHIDNKGNVFYIAVDVDSKEYYVEPDSNAKVLKTTDTAAVQEEKTAQVAAAVETQAQQAGMSLQNLSDLAAMAVNGVRDPALAITGLESILSATQVLQGGVIPATATASYSRVGLDVANLVINSRSAPLDTAMTVLEAVGNSTGVDKPSTAKAIYGARAAGTVLLMAQQLKEG